MPNIHGERQEKLKLEGKQVNFFTANSFTGFWANFAGHKIGMQIRIRMCRNSSVRVARGVDGFGTGHKA